MGHFQWHSKYYLFYQSCFYFIMLNAQIYHVLCKREIFGSKVFKKTGFTSLFYIMV
ncbi:Uncharacterised protein [Porphyromonas macacae]|uniref:Uncharacterized protein n=1 Tax=Porphyromonas macacae TaxID=28115 RepID=A0A379DKK1_9PORP|nr:Uncharacterised protein [Porphyromonas macacae]